MLLTTAFFSNSIRLDAPGHVPSSTIGSATPRLAGIPAPEDVLGFVPGDDRKLASWNQVLTYFEALAKASDRVKFETLGKSTMGKPFVMATISAPENLARLDEYKNIQELLADPRKLGPPGGPRPQSGGTNQTRQDDRAHHLRHSFDRSGFVSFEHAHRASSRFVK